MSCFSFRSINYLPKCGRSKSAFLRIWIFAIVLANIPIVSVFGQSGAAPENQKDIAEWITSTFAKGHIPPFSFVYKDKSSKLFITKWTYADRKEKTDNPGIIQYHFTYTANDKSLQVNCEVTGYPAYNTVEWTLHFVNISGHNSGMLQSINAADYTLNYGKEGNSTLLHALGSDGERSDFLPVSTKLDAGQSVHLFTRGGRSSDSAGLPFFNIQYPDKEGIVVAIGWSGNWFADITPHENRGLTIAAGMSNINLFLYPGESIRSPSICILRWQGDDQIDGNNHFRRFLLAHHSRMIQGRFATYPMAAGFQSGSPDPCNENTCLTEDFALAIVHRYQQFKIVPELFWLDAGWYTGSGGPNNEDRNWYNQVGNWTVDSTRFPRGLKPISDAVHKAGAKFMLWFEPERVVRGTLFDREHPEWMLKIQGSDNYLFDLGNKNACIWLTNYISKMIVENGLDYYRQDFNMDPAPYWSANDETGRIGIKEIRHIEGLYQFWDTLLTRFPNLLIDNCASGGRRLDLETVSRSAPLWRTDYSYGEPNGYQNHTYGLSLWLPLNGTGVFAADTFTVRSSMSSAMVMSWPITSAVGSITDMQHFMRQYTEIRPYFYEDYYPLTGIRDLTGDDVWLAYQLHRPSDNTGIVMAFRRKDAKINTIAVKLSGLDKTREYEIFNDNDGKTTILSGAALETGFDLRLADAPSSLLLRYRMK